MFCADRGRFKRVCYKRRPPHAQAYALVTRNTEQCFCDDCEENAWVNRDPVKDGPANRPAGPVGKQCSNTI